MCCHYWISINKHKCDIIMKFSKTKERKENNNLLCEDNDTKFLHTDNIFNKRYELHLSTFIYF